MQLTRFDRWLREKFVYETHILTLRMPERVPRGVSVKDLPDIPGKRYKHLFIVKKAKAMDALLTELKESNMMFTTRIVDRDRWYVPFIAPKNKSVTWWLLSMIVIAVSSVSALWYVKTLLDNPETRKNLLESLEILKG